MWWGSTPPDVDRTRPPTSGFNAFQAAIGGPGICSTILSLNYLRDTSRLGKNFKVIVVNPSLLKIIIGLASNDAHVTRLSVPSKGVRLKPCSLP
jgi:hypothetical protein